MVRQFRAYLFDVDGTLVDSADDICRAIQGVLTLTRRTDVSNDFIRGYIGRHLTDLFEDLLPEYTREQTEELVQEYRRIYPARQHAQTRVYPSVAHVLSRLPGRKATATTKGTPTTRIVLGKFGLLPYFDHVQGTDGFPAKPHPDVIFKALEGLGMSAADCLFVGDSTADMEAGRRAGVARCAVTYGYGKREDLARFEPDFWIDNLGELLDDGHLPAAPGPYTSETITLAE